MVYTQLLSIIRTFARILYFLYIQRRRLYSKVSVSHKIEKRLKLKKKLKNNWIDKIIILIWNIYPLVRIINPYTNYNQINNTLSELTWENKIYSNLLHKRLKLKIKLPLFFVILCWHCCIFKVIDKIYSLFYNSNKLCIS